MRKGTSVPVNDGRTIALVHFGGMMNGARGAGALKALQELGLTHAFDQIYATSAGFANSCFFLTGDMKVGASIYYENLCSKKFLNLERVWDVVNIDYLLELLRTEKPLDYAALSGSKTCLYARLYNLFEKKTEYKLVNGMAPEEIERVIHAAISLPYLDPGSVEVDHASYKDAGQFRYEADHVLRDILASDATDILVLYNYYEQFEELRRAGLTDSERVYQIVPYAEESFSRISTDSKVLKNAALSMGTIVKSIFGEDEPISLI